MDILAKEDIDQTDKSDRNKLALCPHCGQKLFEIESMHAKGALRQKCRRCRKYIQVFILGKEG